MNCDGISDLLVGAPMSDSGGDDAGAAYLVAGGESRSGEVALSDADARFVGEGAGDHAGKAVSAAGDVDGDGANDFVIGAPRDDSSGGDAGAAYLFRADCPEPDHGGDHAGNDHDGDEHRRTTTPTTTTTDTTSTGTTTTTSTGTTTTTSTGTTTTSTGTTTESPSQPEENIQFVNCTAVRVTGDFETVMVESDFYLSEGIGNEIRDYGPVHGEKLITVPNRGITGSKIIGVTAYEGNFGPEPIRKANDECGDIRPAKPTVSFVGQNETGNGTVEVTFRYTNPNDETLYVSTEFEGRVNDAALDSFEPGTHQFSVEWTPDGPDDRLVWTVDLRQFGYDAISARSDPPSNDTTTPGEPAGSIEFLNCTAAKVTGDFENVMVNRYFYPTPDATSTVGDSVQQGPVDGTLVLDYTDEKAAIGTIEAYPNGIGGEKLYKENPYTDCGDAIQYNGTAEVRTTESTTGNTTTTSSTADTTTSTTSTTTESTTAESAQRNANVAATEAVSTPDTSTTTTATTATTNTTTESNATERGPESPRRSGPLLCESKNVATANRDSVVSHTIRT